MLKQSGEGRRGEGRGREREGGRGRWRERGIEGEGKEGREGGRNRGREKRMRKRHSVAELLWSRLSLSASRHLHSTFSSRVPRRNTDIPLTHSS